MIRVVFFVLCLASATLALPVEDPLLPGALPATTTSKFLPFKEIGSRIINGSPASRGQFPWQAALYITFPSGGISFCGGSLISSEWILTVAHCLRGVSAVTAYLGVVSLSDTSRVVAYASRAIVHPGFNFTTLDNDIALLQLSSPITRNSFIRTIPLANSTLGSGVSVTVSGWGKTSDCSSISETLNFADLTTITNSECAKIYGDVGSGVVCARGTTNQSTCNGDSGGPLITGSGSSALLAGIVSYGHRNGCALGYPVGLTRVAAYRSWITSNSGV